MISVSRIRKAYQRRILAKLYSLSNRVECPYCGWTGWKFLPAGAARKPNRLCPQCGSLERYRMALLYLQQEPTFLNQELRILELAPKDCSRSFLKRLPKVKYVSSDLMTPGAMVFSDLTRMGMASESFDFILCTHVMEHILKDRAAFSELRRILSPKGFGLLMVPIRGNETLEIPDTNPEDYKRLYGQEDHVRWYGLDIVERMQTVGLQVKTLDMFQLLGQAKCRRYALYGDDRYFFRFSRV